MIWKNVKATFFMLMESNYLRRLLIKGKKEQILIIKNKKIVKRVIFNYRF